MRFVSDDRVVDRGANKRKMAVIAAGLPRCATSSLQKALESDVIGCYPSMHMAHVVPHSDRGRLVLQAMNETDTTKRQALLYELFDGCAATCDFPGVMFTTDLMDMYPDACIVLNQRDNAEVWADSLLEAIVSFNTWYHKAATCLFATDRMHAAMIEGAFKKWNAFFSIGPEPTKPAFVKLYHAYNEHVRQEAAKRGKRVLEYNPRDGMGPLCEFVAAENAADVRIPKDVVEAQQGQKLPAVNDRKQMEMLRKFLLVRGLVAWAGIFVGVGMVIRWLPKAFRVVREMV